MKQKKLLALIGSICLILVLASLPFMEACAKPAPAPAPAPPPAPTPTPAPAPPPAKVYEWKCGGPGPIEHVSTKAELRFAELINERTNGQIKVKVYPSSALGSMYDEFDNVVRGVQEMGFLPPSPHYNKALQVVYLPYIVSSWEEGQEAFSPGGWMFELLKPIYAEEGLELLGFSHLGVDGYSNNLGTVIKPSDITDLGIKTRVWCTADRLLWEQVGPTVSMPMADLYTALETGVCHAQDNAPQATYMHVRDVQDYYTQVNWMFEVFPVIMNKELYDSLTPELQTAVDECMAEALSEANAKAEAADEEYRQKLADYGIEVTMLTEEQLEVWKELGRAIWPAMKEECGAEALDYVIAHAK